MLYDNERDRYFDDEFEACDYYWSDGEHLVPEVLYETKPFLLEPDEFHIKVAASKVIEFADSDICELSAEDEYFSELISKENVKELEELIAAWFNKVNRTVVPDYSKPLAFTPIYEDFLKDNG